MPPVPLTQEAPRALHGLRIAWTDDMGGIPVTAGTRDALAGMAAALVQVGGQVQHAQPAVDLDQVFQIYGSLYGATVFAMQPRVARAAIRLLAPVMFRDSTPRSGRAC